MVHCHSRCLPNGPLQAPCEAEAQCAAMVKSGMVRRADSCLSHVAHLSLLRPSCVPLSECGWVGVGFACGSGSGGGANELKLYSWPNGKQRITYYIQYANRRCMLLLLRTWTVSHLGHMSCCATSQPVRASESLCCSGVGAAWTALLQLQAL